MSDERRILVTGDDGIDSPGLAAAVESVLGLGEVVVVAPTRQQTGAGRSVLRGEADRLAPRPLVFRGVPVSGFHADASPAFLVRHALETLLLACPPALVVSGINYGENLGSNVTHSGTVGAALEAASSGIPALAASLETPVHNHREYAAIDWTAAQAFVRRFARLLLGGWRFEDVDVLKLDVPASATPDTAWRLTRQAAGCHYVVAFEDPGPDTAFRDGRVEVASTPAAARPGTDVHALLVERVVSVTPISLDMTSRSRFSALDEALRAADLAAAGTGPDRR